MIDIINQYILPAAKTAGVGPLVELGTAVDTLKQKLHEIHHTSDNVEKVRYLVPCVF